MSDLISRSKLLKEIEVWGGCVEALHEYISIMPTAYDVEKVVAKLEVLQCVNPFLTTTEYKHKAIDIVKRGGVE